MALKETNFNLHPEQRFYKGKVRDVYIVEDHFIAIASDRISAFDHILPKAIPHKGQVLNQIAAYFLNSTTDIVPNWLIHNPDPNVSIGLVCEPIRIEMVIRNYLVGHAWREYDSGKRILCGVKLKEGMIANQKFDRPIITPATKAESGHDIDISKEDIIAQKIISTKLYEEIERYTYLLFERGQKMAEERGLILVDTKYEFGVRDNQVYLIDEIHTPDSSRYFYKDSYEERFTIGQEPIQLSKEFVREWLMQNNFRGLEGQAMPDMPDSFVTEVSDKYINLYELLIGEKFIRDSNNIKERIYNNVSNFLHSR